jgi:hypothetical protein
MLSEAKHLENASLVGGMPRTVMLSAAKHLRLCAKASGGIGSYPSQHEVDHGEEDPGLFTAGK